MARVELGRLREQSRHYGLYKQSSPTGDLIVVRRKVGEPVDYQHDYSRAVKRQREVFTQASVHYSHLTSRQRQELKTHVEEVEYIRGHGLTDVKLLQGRALFISKDIHSLITTADYLPIPGEICVVLADQFHNPIPGYLRLYYYTEGERKRLYPVEISPSNFLFTDVPPNMSAYYFWGSSVGYYDYGSWQPTFLTWHQVQRYHYHCLKLGYIRYSFTYGIRAWIQGWCPTFAFPINTVRWQTHIWSGDYQGYLRIGIRDYSGERPLGEFIFEESYYLSPAQPDPKIITFTKHNLNLKPSGRYYLHSYRLDPFSDVALPAYWCMEFQP